MNKICHITTGMNIGGAEIFMLNLAISLNALGYKQQIISLQGRGDLSGKLSNSDIELIHLGISRYPWTWWAILKLPFLLRKLSPDVIQTWLYHADLIGGLASIFTQANLIWNIRQTDISVKNNKNEIVIVAKIAAALSKYLPKKIICCSESVEESHVNIGYMKSKFVVIPNGCDTNVYKPDKVVRDATRLMLGIDEGDIVIGRFGRFDPQKDYSNFISAGDRIFSKCKNVWFLMAGENVSFENPELRQLISSSDAHDRYMLLGKRTDLPDIYQSVDIMVSSSLGEGFPNVVAEAMACEVPCVVTDVGESASLVGDTGRTVPKKDVTKLADACLNMVEIGAIRRQKLGSAARSRIIKYYSMDRSVAEYRALYDQMPEK